MHCLHSLGVTRIKILIVHNFYSSKNPSGENDVVRYESQLLKRLGHEVMLYEVQSDIYSSANFFTNFRRIFQILLPYSLSKSLSQVIKEFQPGVIHCHNLFPYIGTSVLKAGNKNKIRVVQTIHNYRLGCIAGTYFRDNQICHKCTKNSVWGVIFKCYRSSLLQSVVMTLQKLKFRKDIHLADAIVCMSNYMSDWLAILGVDKAKLLVKMTPVETVSTTSPNRESKILIFVGRLSPEKGVETLIEAFLGSNLISKGYVLKIVGGGELADYFRGKYGEISEVKFLGNVPQLSVDELIADSTVLCVPSMWFEGSPRVVSQAISLGVPVIVSNLGSLGGLPDKLWIRKVEPTVLAWINELNNLNSWILGLDSADIKVWARLNVSETATVEMLYRAYAIH